MSGYGFCVEPVEVQRVATAHRRIVTALPAPGTKAIIDELSRYEPRSLAGGQPLVWDRAEGYNVFDRSGNKWIDFTSTIFVANVGHAHPVLKDAIVAQVEAGLLHTYCYPSAIRARLVCRLVERTPASCEKVILLSTGSEATECAIKLMKMHGRRRSPRQDVVVSFSGAFHGRTMGAQLAGGNPSQKDWIGAGDLGFRQIPFPFCRACPQGRRAYQNCGAQCFERSMSALAEGGTKPERIAGFLLESYQGWGALFYPEDYVQALRTWADRHGALVAFDEVQSGYGRTGTFLAYERYGVEADLVCVGKGMTGSLPMSAVLGRARVLDIPEAGAMSSTHTGNPLCCAAAVAVLDIMRDEHLVAESARKGRLLGELLDTLAADFPEEIAFVTGRGLLYALHMKRPAGVSAAAELADRVTECAFRRGLLTVHTGRETIKIGPPLCIPDEALREGVEVLREAVSDCAHGLNRRAAS